MHTQRSTRKNPAHWHLNLFMLAMILGAFACFWIGLPAQHETLFAVGWSTATLSGMAVWLYNNEPALRAAEQARRQRAHDHAHHAHWLQQRPTPPRTPVPRALLEHAEDQQHDSARAELEPTGAEDGVPRRQCVAESVKGPTS